MRRILPFFMAAAVALGTVSIAWAHARPVTTNPAPNARLDALPGRVAIAYDEAIEARDSSIQVLDAGGNPVATTPDPPEGATLGSVTLPDGLAPGPYTVAWTSRSQADGHEARGFYTFVVNGGPVGIVSGWAQAQVPAADLTATLTVTQADDGGSLLRVDLDNPAGVERVRVRLERPDLGSDLLTLEPLADGGWALAGNEVAVTGTWHATVIVRRQDVADDAQATFDFVVDPSTGQPQFL
jgi:copper resistance protein C